METQQEQDRMILASAPTDKPLNDIELAALERERDREATPAQTPQTDKHWEPLLGNVTEAQAEKAFDAYYDRPKTEPATPINELEKAIRETQRQDAAQASGNCQTSHSPLPWSVMNTDGKPPKIINAGKPGFIATLGFPSEGDREANAAFIVRACNHAQRLADALNRAVARLDYAHNKGVFNTQDNDAIEQGRETLAQWTKANE